MNRVSTVNYGTPINRTDTQETAEVSYMKKEVDLETMPLLFFPPGKEMLFLGLYFAVISYIVGLFILFFYISGRQLSIFKAITTEASPLLVWMVGYELLAAMLLAYIALKATVTALTGKRH